MQAIFRPSANRDLADIVLYIEENGGGSGVSEKFIADIVKRCERIASLPGTLGTDRGDLRPGIRSTPHGSYIILFRYTGDTVEIVNVFHASRDVTTYYEES